VDEEFGFRELHTIARQLGLDLYRWSLTRGLEIQVGMELVPYEESREPAKMIVRIMELLDAAKRLSGLFVLVDFDRHLEDNLVLRLFKDAVSRVRGCRDTFIILAHEYELPVSLEPDTACICGGYPAEDELAGVVREALTELARIQPGISVKLSPDDVKSFARALRGLTVQQVRNVVNQCGLSANHLTIADLGSIESAKKKIFDREGLLEFHLSEARENIAGFDHLKTWLSERRGSFVSTGAFPLPPPKGVLLLGVQGCGKSLAAKVIARELELPLYRLDVARLYSKYIGETEQNLRRLLSVVDRLSPLCLWVDEIEKGFAASHTEVDGGVSQRVLGTFLTWMQERKSSCFLAATANAVASLPPEFLRKGRFDETFFVDLPTPELREQVYRIHLGRRGLAPGQFDLARLVEDADGFSGAEIEQAIISALYRAGARSEPLTTDHVRDQLRHTRPLSVVKAEEIAELREWAAGRTIPA